jgi:hypothetical protein
MKWTDRLWYRRTFQVPERWRGQRILLHFGAVDWESTVYLNGRELGTHRGGYDPFSFEITDALRPSGDQELIVKVFDPTNNGSPILGKQILKPAGCSYTPTTGIWQTVWLEPVPAARIDRLVMTPDIDASCLHLTVEGRGAGADMTVEAIARDGSTEVARAAGPVGANLTLSIPKEKQELWSPDHPFLYDLSVTLRQGDKPIDQVQSYFGQRKIDLGKDPRGFVRLRLNHQFVFQMGPLDQGFWPDGLYTAPTDEALRYDIEVTKQLGFNMTRKHVKVEPARWYYWCDRLGLLVWQDMPSGPNGTPEAKTQFESELRRMVDRLRNHPSIVMWVVFNEGWGQHDTPRYVEMVKRLDPSRLVNSGSGSSDATAGDVVDMHNYPPPNAPAPEPRRANVLGEFGGLGLTVPGHTWTKEAWGYQATGDAAALTARYEDFLDRVYQLRDSQGLSAAVYTQITDVETECNGLLTYDRAVIKPDLVKVAAANQGRGPRHERQVIVPVSDTKPFIWRYTFERPAEGWFRPDFDDSAWKQGPAGFGHEGVPNSFIRTPWNTSDIWIRRTVDLPAVNPGDLRLLIHHDEDADVYLNGILAAQPHGFTVGYETVSLRPEAVAALKPGPLVIAVHCKQTVGGQYIDLGLAAETTIPPGEKR